MKTDRITYLDAATLDAGDIDFSPLEALGELTLHRFTAPEERAERAEPVTSFWSTKWCSTATF